MRTNIDIDEALLETAMRAGPYKTKKDAVEAGLKLLARQARYRDILKWEGRLRWEGDDVEGASPARAPVARGRTTNELLAREPDAATPASIPRRRHAGR